MAQFDLLLTQNIATTGIEFSEKYVNITKGGLLSALVDGTPAVLAAGTNGYHLERDDTQVTGLIWVVNANLGQLHTQNTDTGTTSSTFDIDSDGTVNGVRLKANTGVLEVRTLADTAYASLVTKNLIVNGDFTVNGLTSTINTQTLNVDDKNIELGAVISVAGVTGAILSTDVLMTGMSSTVGLIPGMTITVTGGTGTLTSVPTIISVDSPTQITMSANAATSGSPIVTFGAASDFTADGGGITLKGTTDKTILWDNANDNWTLNQNVNIPTGFQYKINNVPLSAADVGALSMWVAAPATKTSAGTDGQIAKDLNFFYVCVNTNVWTRSPLCTNWT